MKTNWIYLALIPVSVTCLILWSAAPVAAADSYVIGSQSRALLTQSDAASPDNYAVAYYLGKACLADGDTDAAIEAWERYVAIAPADGKSAAVRERLTVMKLRRADRLAREAAAGRTPEGEIEGNTVAVLNFQTPPDSDSAVLSKGLTAMIITDLSKVPTLKVVEREKMQALLQEIRLGQTGLVDEATAVKAGRLLLARNLVRGDLTPPDPETIRVTSTVTETLNGTDLGGPDAQGPVDELFEMEKRLVFGILGTMGISRDDMDPETRKAVDAYHTRSLDALMSYAQGLDYLDMGRFGEAKDAFQNAVELDPEFNLANEAMISTPADLSSVEDLEGLELMELEAEDMAGGQSDELETDTRIDLADIEVVDVAQDEISAELSNELLWRESPAFPEKPDTSGDVRIDW